ncbi:leucine-rich repeat receptor protein kinase HPCA1 [Hevea brasiliensis]|uniref:leucine-rich repeat receptor protein kinase HPCA1 n=1 Tax=Hevea brasiliensis TaxID=3981 RepID=UPI0025CB9C49|nr:leucine-rich repeat receptor protein kinase HPCA1 [Hevea brasiliensis]
MDPGKQIFLLIMYLQVFLIAAVTDPHDFTALSAVKSNWQNTPPNWIGFDPCREVSTCRDLSQNMGLTGTLPQAIGNLKKLLYLSLASNKFIGEIPPSIGNLLNLYLLDVTDNKLTGTIPVSNETSPGLDLLVNTRHFHLGQNQLTGTIPLKLFSSKMTLIHLLLDSNQLSGSIPSSLERVQSLELIRLDRNSLNGPVLLNFTGLTNLSQLYLSNNKLTGPMPDLSGMNLVTYVDMSNNSFDASSIPPWFSSLQSLTSLIMERTQLQGQIPDSIFSVAQLQSVVLSNNQLNGTLDIGTNYGTQLELIDLQNNSITEFAQGSGYSKTLMLQGNPFCATIGSTENYCSLLQQPNTSYSPPPNNCVQHDCNSNQIISPRCKCAYPITGTLKFRSISFSDLGNAGYYNHAQALMMDAFQSIQFPVDSIALSDPFKDEYDYLELRIEVFPSNSDSFNRTGFSMITSQLNNLTFFQLPSSFGPLYFTLDNNDYFSGPKSNKGIIIGAAIGSSILALLLLMTGIYAFKQRRKADTATEAAIRLRDPFASWDRNESAGSRPQIKGLRCFTFEELKKCTNNFSDANIIGIGGYGRVYRGILTGGKLVAIKRAQRGSLQGNVEFKTEIELLSRVHHKNLVSLVGFCYELDEQMLVYEHISNGTLKDSISGKSGIQLSWARRLQIALDSARGLTYLHELANPPIIHRDIKSTNILLDDQLTAKVADFGLSKPLDHTEGHVSTQVKGTMGYMDPEYFMTQQLTDKSDVYSFGVVMLELVTGRNPIHHGRHIVTVVRMAMDKTKDLYNLHEILDPAIGVGNTLKGLEKFVDLAIRCVEEWRANRPAMGQVVKEIENIAEQAGLDYDFEMLSTSASHYYSTNGSLYLPDNKKFYEYSESFPHSEIELQ